MELHKRFSVVSKADTELWDAIAGIIEKHGLTTVEVTGLLLNRAVHYQRYALRLERHGNYEDKADEA